MGNGLLAGWLAQCSVGIDQLVKRVVWHTAIGIYYDNESKMWPQFASYSMHKGCKRRGNKTIETIQKLGEHTQNIAGY